MPLIPFLRRAAQGPIGRQLLVHLGLFSAAASVHLSMAPYYLWPLALLAPWALAWGLHRQSFRSALVRGFTFNLGLFVGGVSWIYVSISQFGNTSAELALALMVLFIAGISLLFLLPYAIYGRWFNRSLTSALWAFPAVFVLGEWLRSWLLTGFPWLYLGYGLMPSPLVGWAPVFGVFGVSFFGLVSGALLLGFWQSCAAWPKRSGYLWVLAALWAGGWQLSHTPWTTPKDSPISIGLVQPNIPQEEKWDPVYYAQNIAVLRQLSQPLWGKDWVVWPEAAIPLLYHNALPLLEQLDRSARQAGSVLISGIIYDDIEKDRYYNSILARGDGGQGLYFKQRLVPFGEYVPLEVYLRGLIAFFDLPTSIIHVGPEQQTGLHARDLQISPAICYEIVYPALVAEHARGSQIILTISNDAWFADSIGPLQHFQMAQMRAIETRRYVVRGTNTGMTGIIDPFGRTLVEAERFKRQSISGEAYGVDGLTPYMLWRNWPVLLVSLGCLLWSLSLARKPNSKQG
jgi:apolipoprotein N-acyltransferase